MNPNDFWSLTIFLYCIGIVVDDDTIELPPDNPYP
jgi:hypothetical protein